VVAACFLQRFQRFLTAHRAHEGAPERTQHQQGEPGIGSHDGVLITEIQSGRKVQVEAHRNTGDAWLGALGVGPSVNLHMSKEMPCTVHLSPPPTPQLSNPTRSITFMCIMFIRLNHIRLSDLPDIISLIMFS
jgi:hypothetical protein